MTVTSRGGAGGEVVFGLRRIILPPLSPLKDYRRSVRDALRS